MAYGARLESGLGETPQGFKSPILRHLFLSVILIEGAPVIGRGSKSGRARSIRRPTSSSCITGALTLRK